MRKIFIIFILAFVGSNLFSQTKKIFLEEFTSSFCCYSGDAIHYIDSLLDTYPELISVSCHAGYYEDSMWFEEIDTLSNGFQINAVPLGSIDRLYHPSDSVFGTWEGVGQPENMWDTLIQERLTIPASLTVNFDSISWDSITRDISVSINVDIFTNLPQDDYRIGLYVVEDSVIGYQIDSTCNPLNNYCHRRVSRALLPSAWSPQGILPTILNAGQNYNTTIDYNLPNAYNENQIFLIAFVYRYSANHQNDEVLNVEQVPLDYVPVQNNVEKINETDVLIYPNPTTDFINIDNVDFIKLRLFNQSGTEVAVYKRKQIIDISSLPKGIYILSIITESNIINKKIVKQ